MRINLRKGSQRYEILDLQESQPDDTLKAFRNKSAALNFLRGFSRDPLNITSLRKFLVRGFAHSGRRRLPDHKVLEHIAYRLASGQLKIAVLPVSMPAWSHIEIPPIAEEAAPKEEKKDEEEKKVAVEIKAKNGKDPPPSVIGVKTSIKLKGVPSKGSGKYQWSTSSPRLTLKNKTSQIVKVKAGDKPTPAGSEEIQLVFTPSGKSALPAVKHAIKVGTVLFAREVSHQWGYDAYETVSCKDKDGNSFSERPGPKKDFISIKKGEVGKVKVDLNTLTPSDVYFKSTNTTVCVPKAKQPNADPFVLEIQAKNKKKAEANIEARVGSISGPVVAKVGVVVLKEARYKAELFRVKDSTSAGTALTTAITVADTKTYLNDAFKPGVAVWALSGSAGETDVAYDKTKNGAVDMEPGKTSAEVKAISKACKSTKTRVIQVHALRWAFYLAADAAATDNKIKLKKYGELKFIGKKSYRIEDNKGNSKNVTITSVNKATGRLTLSAAIGQEFKKADKAALIFPLLGLSGDPIWVEDKSSAAGLKNVIAHELGHQVSNLNDVCEIDNLMYGTGDNSLGLRRRGIKRYYNVASKDKQWRKMTR